MRRSEAAIAVIRRNEGDQILWLAQWNKSWSAFSFVGGHKRPDESFRQCMVREVIEELELEPDEQFTVASEPLAHLEYTAWSESAQVETQYTMELFEVELTNAARRQVDDAPKNRWLTEDEIRKQQTVDRQPVSSTMQLILEKAGLGRSQC